MATVHVVPHTHWDREWYRPAAVFGLRLAHLADGLLAAMAKSPGIRAFLLDGQGVVLDDLAELRPARRDDLRRLLAARRIEAGPWYVLADEFLVSAEALVRNLIEGANAVRRCGGDPMRVGYVPDSFGHSGALPTVLAGFGMGVAVAWRGLGGRDRRGEPSGDTFRWRSADGSEVLLHHLPTGGYEFGANLPAGGAGAERRWRELKALLASRARGPHWLVMNGADHHALQADVARAVRALARAARSTGRSRDRGTDRAPRVKLSSLGGWAREVEKWARRRRAELPVVVGDLRGGREHAWALLGTIGTRLHLKQANARCEAALERVAEPLAALASLRGAPLAPDLGAAWRELLRNQPHDSICGTSTDEVHREMVTRFARVRAMAAEIAGRSLDAAVGHDADAARQGGREAWRGGVLVFNGAPRTRGALVEADVPVFREDVPVGLVASREVRRTAGARAGPGEISIAAADGETLPHQELARWSGTDLVESPRHYPDCDKVEWRRIVFPAPHLPALGIAGFTVRGRAAAARGHRAADAVQVSHLGLANRRLSVRVASDGSVEITERASGIAVRGLGVLEDQADLGDSYTPSPRGRVTSRADEVAVRVAHEGPLVGELVILRRYRALDLQVITRVRLEAGARHVSLGFAGENRRGDHRLRALFPLGEAGRRIVAGGQFGPVEPGFAVRRGRRGRELEAPEPTAPLHRWVAVSGRRRALVVFTDGLPQYEAREDGSVRVTLLRACGELSRDDLPQRPGHAGWPVATPEGQCLGPFEANLAVALASPRELDAADRLEALADDVLLRPLAFQRRALLRLPAAVAGPVLEGDALAFSSMKPAEDGRGVVLRCFNATGEAVRGAWVVPWRVREAAWCRLDETAVARLRVLGGRVGFEAGPRAVVTVRVS